MKILKGKKVSPLSLLSFKACCDTFSLDRKCTEDITNKLQSLFTERSPSPARRIDGRCNKDSKTSPVKFTPLDETGKLHAFFKKHVKPKKQHEIKNLGQFCEAGHQKLLFVGKFHLRVGYLYEDPLTTSSCGLSSVIYLLSEHIKCDTVIDVGSGLGHLARLLSFGYNLNVTSVEAAGTHAPKATKYDREIDREIKKKTQTSTSQNYWQELVPSDRTSCYVESNLTGVLCSACSPVCLPEVLPVIQRCLRTTTEGKLSVDIEVSLPCHVTSMIYPNMSAEEFLAIITSQQKQEFYSETSVTDQQDVSVSTGGIIRDGLDTCGNSSHTSKRDVQDNESDCNIVDQCIEKHVDKANKGVEKLKPDCNNVNQCKTKELDTFCKREETEQDCSSTSRFTNKDIDTYEKLVNEIQADCDDSNECSGIDYDDVKVDVQNLCMETVNEMHKERQLFKRMKYMKPDSGTKTFDDTPVHLNEFKGYSDPVKSTFGEKNEFEGSVVSLKLSDSNSPTHQISTVDLASSSDGDNLRSDTRTDLDQQCKTSSRDGQEASSFVKEIKSGLVNVSENTETSDTHKQDKTEQVDSSKWRFVLTGLHACGDLTPTFLRFFVNCKAAVGLASVGCCYMKISDESSCDKTVGYPMSQYAASLPNHTLSYASRELACHFADTYSQRLKECPPLLKIHSYRAALEWIANHLCPGFKRTAVQIPTKKTNSLQFDRYVRLGLQKLSIPEERLTDDILNEAYRMTEQWKDVVAFYTIRLALAPVVETLILLDRMIFLYEKGYVSALVPVFDPGLSPRNFVLLSWKDQH